MDHDAPSPETGRFDVLALAATLPETARTMLADIYLSDHAAASARIFRVYKAVPAHYHETCHEHLYVLSGRGSFWVGEATAKTEIGPGQLVVFERGAVHAIPDVLEEPLVFLAIDAPRRAPTDIVFVDPATGSAATFMARNADD